MTTAHRRAWFITAALAWFMVGLHVPAFHALEHGDTLPAPVLVATVGLGLLALVATVALWRGLGDR